MVSLLQSFSIATIGVVVGSYLSIKTLSAYFFLVQILFIISAINFTFIISLSFRSTKTASDVGTLLILFLFMLTTAQSFLNKNWVYIVCSWIPQIAYIYGVKATEPEKQTIGALLLAGQALGYFLLYLYLVQVIPNAHGIRKHPLFFLRRDAKEQLRRSDGTQEPSLMAGNYRTSAFYEDNQTDPNKEPVVYIKSLTKKFGKFTAVDNVSLGVYSGEVMCLLGHNGAGKTTLINMLCNFYRPSSGSIFCKAIHFSFNLFLKRRPRPEHRGEQRESAREDRLLFPKRFHLR